MKHLSKYISNCKECPYYRFDAATDYNRDGHDCHNFKDDYKVIKESEWNDEFPIPDWCPLDDSGEKDKSLKELIQAIHDIKKENDIMNNKCEKSKKLVEEFERTLREYKDIWSE